MAEGVKKYTGEDFDAVTTVEEARALADRLNVEYTDCLLYTSRCV